jgi:hypothetical protein
MTDDSLNTGQQVVVTNISMPFGSMVIFMIKWAIASIPAVIILSIIGFFAWAFILSLLGDFRGVAIR